MSGKRYFLILFLLIAFPSYPKCQDYIRMDYNGPIDKPFNTIIVSKVNIPDSGFFVVNIVLSVDTFNLVKETMLGCLPAENQHEVDDDGCFVIKIRTKDQINNYYLSSLNISKVYFRKILKFLRKENINSEVSDNIQTYLRRIGV